MASTGATFWALWHLLDGWVQILLDSYGFREIYLDHSSTGITMKCAKFSITYSWIAIKLCMNIYASHWMNWTLVWKDMCTKCAFKGTTIALSIICLLYKLWSWILSWIINHDTKLFNMSKSRFRMYPEECLFFQYIMTWALEPHLTFWLSKLDYENTKSTFGHGWCSEWGTYDPSLLLSVYLYLLLGLTTAFQVRIRVSTWQITGSS